MSKKILIIDDDLDICTLLNNFLTKKGYEVTTALSGKKGIAQFTEKPTDIVICDYRLGDMEGTEVITALRAISSEVIILVITGYSDIRTAVEVMKLGAFDYITKPLIADEVLSVLNKALHPDQQKDKAKSDSEPAKTVGGKFPAKPEQFMVGNAASTKSLYEQIRIVAPTNYSIILYGESGTGKEVIAKTIHDLSNRKNKPFIAMDCGTLSRELSGSELFGHVKGAFTGASSDKEGHFEIAEGGTLFLDEIANLPAEVQATLLRVIQERKFKRVGGNKEMDVDVRIIVASNENLQEAYRKGKFREDLYHRFNEFSINLPPLRNRLEDIPHFAEFFLVMTNEELGKKVIGFEPDVLKSFTDYSWPGNLREFRNVVRRAVLLTNDGTYINKETLPWEITNNQQVAEPESPVLGTGLKTGPQEMNLKSKAIEAEYLVIMEALKQVNFNKRKAAELLKIDRKTLYNKLKEFQRS